MTESQIESLLRQMTVSAPSTTLDQKVARTVQRTSAPNNGHPRHWWTVSATAAACLLLGVAIGRATGTPKPSATSAVPAPPKASETGVRVTNMTKVEADEFIETLYAPNVTMLCAMEDVHPDRHTTKCVTCHSGLPAAASHFQKEHTKHPSFGECRMCHDQMQPPNAQLNDPLPPFGHPDPGTTKCVTCHSTASTASPRLPTEHTQRPGFTVCMVSTNQTQRSNTQLNAPLPPFGHPDPRTTKRVTCHSEASTAETPAEVEHASFGECRMGHEQTQSPDEQRNEYLQPL